MNRKHFGLILTLAHKNVKLKYKNSALGFLWSLLNPLLYLLIFTFIFSQAFPDIENYPLFALTGMVFWTFFSNATNEITQSLIVSAGILKSVNIPAISFPLAGVVAELINLLLSFIPFSGLMFFLGFRPGWEIVLVIPALLLFVLFTFGFGLILCTLNVFFRDVGILWQSLTPALFYFTPIAYSYQLIPESYRWIITLNPLYHYFRLIREILYHHRVPGFDFWLIPMVTALFVFSISLVVYKRMERGFISNF